MKCSGAPALLPRGALARVAAKLEMALQALGMPVHVVNCAKGDLVRGRKPKPTALKLLEGNPGKRAVNAREPKPRPAQTSALSPRRFLDRYGREEWHRVVPELSLLGLLTTVDLAAVEIYCDLYAQWRRARVKLRTGFTDANGKRKPEAQVVKDTAALMRQYMVEFGLTPSSRARLETDEPPAPSAVKPTGTDGKAPGRFWRDGNV